MRKRQLQSLTVVTAFEAEPGWKAPLQAVCEVDTVRPAAAQKEFKTRGEYRSQSRSVTLRREEGRRLRQDFFQRELKLIDVAGLFAKPDRFTDDFEELARFDPSWPNDRRPPRLLEHKIAVFYADGNGFGGIARDHCPTAETTRSWDQHIQDARRAFLHSLLQWLEAHAHGSAPAVTLTVLGSHKVNALTGPADQVRQDAQ